MIDRPVCRHYHPPRYAWHCAVGYRAPRDCGSCIRYDADTPTDSGEDQSRVRQWKKAHDRRPSA